MTLDVNLLLQAAQQVAGSQQYPKGALYLVPTPIGNLAALSTQSAQAAAPWQEEPELPMTLEEKQGCSCHSGEKGTWQVAPHGELDEKGEPVATCATCHGEYVEGHPDEGMIPLATDSSACIDCHEQTASEWEGTIHAESGMQCISCHLSHTQDLRVTSDHLCRTCHREALQDPLHSAHWPVSYTHLTLPTSDLV